MIRIMTAREPDRITVTVDGRLVGENVAPLETSVKEAMAEGRPVQLFLRDVSSIDHGGRALLARLSANGVHLRASGVYCSWIVAECSASSANARRGHMDYD